ncbi:MAG: hypothetical protein H7Y61_00175 [Rhizobiales bacterium]|nr:hypothetical protein [Rhizobacter sp.]
MKKTLIASAAAMSLSTPFSMALAEPPTPATASQAAGTATNLLTGAVGKVTVQALGNSAASTAVRD